MPRVAVSSVVLVFYLLGAVDLSGQSNIRLGPAIQIYPTGIIPGIEAHHLLSEQAGLIYRIGYNIVRHGDAGVHSDERGGGPGVTIGYQRRIGRPSRWSAEMRTDLWFNSVGWIDRVGQVELASGESKVTVLQPTVALAYKIEDRDETVALIPSLAFGAEINVKTKGAAVGQGAILLAGIKMLFGKASRE